MKQRINNRFIPAPKKQPEILIVLNKTVEYKTEGGREVLNP